MNNFIYKPIIDKELNFYLDKRKNLPTNIKTKIPFSSRYSLGNKDFKLSTEIDFDSYVENLYQSLEIPFISKLTSLYTKKILQLI